MSLKTRLLKYLLVKKVRPKFNELLLQGGFIEEGGGWKSPSVVSNLLPLIPIAAVATVAYTKFKSTKSEPISFPEFSFPSFDRDSDLESDPFTYSSGSYVGSSTTAQSAIERQALSYITHGNPYKAGSHGDIRYSQTGPRDPHQGSADCSSFARSVYLDAVGYDIGYNSDDMWNGPKGVIVDYSGIPSSGEYVKAPRKPNLSVLQKGDLVFFSRPNSQASSIIRSRRYNVMHVGIYLGNDLYIDLGRDQGPFVQRLSTRNPGNYLGAKRYFSQPNTVPVQVSTSVESYSETDLSKSTYNQRL